MKKMSKDKKSRGIENRWVGETSVEIELRLEEKVNNTRKDLSDDL